MAFTTTTTAVLVAAMAATAVVLATQPQCDSSRDLSFVYTDCVDGLRRVVPYWTHDCQPTTADPLPAPRFFSCAAVCPDGYVIGVDGVCAPCPSGTVVESTKEWRGPYGSVPADAFLQCTAYAGNTTNNPCPPSRWEACDDGTCLTSGASGGRILYDQDVSMRFTIDHYPASVTFKYRVSSEAYYDYLAVYLDGKAILVDSGEKQANVWRTFVHELPPSSVQHVSTDEGGGGESAASQRMCHWTFGGFCLYPNQLSPYVPLTFFDAPEFESKFGKALVDVLFRLDESACPPAMSDVAGKYVIWPLVTGAAANHCQPLTIIQSAMSNGAKGVIFGVPDDEVINGTSRSVIPDANAATATRFVVASMRLAEARLVRTHLERHNPSSGVVVKYTARAGIAHRLTFSYSKDGSVDRGADRAWIKDVVVKGSAGVAKCRRCEPGYTSAEGATECQVCPRDTYGEFDGTPMPCRPCGSGFMSPPRSQQCLRAPACEMADYVPIRSRCAARTPEQLAAASSGAVNVSTDGGTFAPAGTVDFVHNITFAPLDPPTCDLATSTVALGKPIINTECTLCPSMQFRNARTGRCESCPARTHLNAPQMTAPSADDACSPCTVGTYANQLLLLSSFDSWHNELPSWVTISCDKCIGAGWALADSAPDSATVGDSVLSVGQAIAAGGVARMEWNVTTIASDVLAFTYSLLKHTTGGSGDTPGGGRVTFQVLQERDGANVTVYSQTLARPTRVDSPFQVTTAPIPAGQNYLVWEFESTRANASVLESGDVYAVRSASLYGATVGSAPSCMLCPPGHMCPEEGPGATGAPQPCPVGHYADAAGAGMCRACPFGFVSPNEGARSCEACPNGTAASWDKRTCVMPLCVLTDGTIGIVPPTPPGSVPVRWSNTPLSASAAGTAPVRIPLQSFNGATAFPISAQGGDTTATGTTRLQGVSVHFTTCEPDLRQCATHDEPSYGCAQTSTGEWFPLGGTLTPRVLYTASGDPEGGELVITGARCHAQPARSMRTVITLVCDPSASDHDLVSARATDPCLYTLRIRSRTACPVCTNRSFVKTQTDCVGDPAVRTTFYDYAFRNGTITRDATCVSSEPNQPDPRPARETEECPWASLKLGNSFDTNWLIVIVVLVLSLLLVVTVVCALVSRGRLASKYNRLQAQGNIGRGETLPTSIGSGQRRTTNAATANNNHGNTADDIEMSRGGDLHPAAAAAAAAAGRKADDGAGVLSSAAQPTPEADNVALSGSPHAKQAVAEQPVDYGKAEDDVSANARDERPSTSPAPSADHAV